MSATATIAALVAALRGVALSGNSGQAMMVEFCDDGWLCHHPECVAARQALADAEADKENMMSTPINIAKIAQVCHEANRAWCAVNGDLTQPSWAEQWQRDSAMAGVRFALANPDAPDSAQHEAWMADKVRDGWRYGEVRSAAAKTHPCLVPFADLPPEQQAKDRLFRAIVKALA